MHDYWGEFGYPVHINVAHYLGLTKPKRAKADAFDAEDIASMLAAEFPDGWV